MTYRVSWWLQRSRSPEYQEAYDKIASYVDLNEDDILVDFGCGNGEIIRRIDKGKIIGIDLSPHMIKAAKKNLRKHGIKVKIYFTMPSPQQWEEEIRQKRPVIILDDFLNSKLPNEFCDQAIHTFTDFCEESVIEYASKNPTVLEVDKMAIQIDKEIHRILKIHGLYTQATYDAELLNEDYLTSQKMYLQHAGLGTLFEIVRTEFILSEPIIRDATFDFPVRNALKPKWKEGYGITVYRKL